MAVNKLYKFRRIDDVLPFLNGGIIGGSINTTQKGGTPGSLGVGISGLVGTTLVFTSPSSFTVTFSASTNASNPDTSVLLFSDIKAQIEAASGATLRVSLTAEQHIIIAEVTPASGVALANASSTAASLLGFDQTINTVGKFYKPAAVSNAAPCWTWSNTGNDNMISVFTWE